MIEKRIIDLINGAMDGELADAERIELDEQLAQSEEARRYHAGMMELNSVLQELPAQEMPAALHDEIIRNVLPARLPRSTTSKSTSNWPGFVRYGFPAAAALVLAVGIYQFGSDNPSPGDIGQMTGTVAPDNVVELDSYSFQTEGLTSSVNLEQRNGTTVLIVEIESIESIDLNIDFTDTDLKYETTLAKTKNDLEFFDNPAQSIHARSSGRQSFTVLLQRVNDTTSRRDGAITLEYLRDGKLVQQGALISR